jgi:hypothetical protein
VFIKDGTVPFLIVALVAGLVALVIMEDSRIVEADDRLRLKR